MATSNRYRRATNSFTADVTQIVNATNEKLLDVMRQSLKDVVENSQTPVSKGGKMRVDTGFLRASGRASLEGWPSGNGVRPADAQAGQYEWEGASLNATLIQMQLGDTFYWGWVANYAPVREVYDGFMDGSLQNWGRVVAFNIDTVNKGSK